MAAPLDNLSDTGEVVLPTFSVLARFRASAPDGPAAVRSVVQRLTAAEEPFHEVSSQSDGGDQLVLVRFVLVSVDAQTAVVGLSETLTAAGLEPDEVWAAGQL